MCQWQVQRPVRSTVKEKAKDFLLTIQLTQAGAEIFSLLEIISVEEIAAGGPVMRTEEEWVGAETKNEVNMRIYGSDQLTQLPSYVGMASYMFWINLISIRPGWLSR